jgi:S-adenosylmethionine-diacylgycerolhomoserine-N-methlytransferase
VPATTHSVWSDLRTVWQLATTRIRGASHAERLESFYRSQAKRYDSFRSRLLHGRDDLIRAIEVPAGGHWVDLGAGTGENAERLGERLPSLRRLDVVDLCPSLLEVARRRIEAECWCNVHVHAADATTFQPEDVSGAGVDVVTCSYSLTMIPDWFAAIENARRMLKPGGTIGVVDFYVSRKYVNGTTKRHGWSTRTFWPAWFASDNVFLSPDHLPYLTSRFETVQLFESRGRIPFLPLVSAPYYCFVGRKPVD